MRGVKTMKQSNVIFSNTLTEISYFCIGCGSPEPGWVSPVRVYDSWSVHVYEKQSAHAISFILTVISDQSRAEICKTQTEVMLKGA